MVTCTSIYYGFIYMLKAALKQTSSKWIDSSSEGHLQGFSSILQGSSSKIVNWIRGQRSNKSLILVRNIEVGFSCLFVHFWQVLSFLFDLWTLIQITVFEEEPCKTEAIWESNLFILKVCFRVYSSLKFQSKF